MHRTPPQVRLKKKDIKYSNADRQMAPQWAIMANQLASLVSMQIFTLQCGQYFY
jgi:hypothetical protein